MKLIRNRQEALKLWPYDTKPKLHSEIPGRFPCLMEYVYCEDSFGCDYRELHHIAIPKNYCSSPVRLQAFIAGATANRKISDPI